MKQRFQQFSFLLCLTLILGHSASIAQNQTDTILASDNDMFPLPTVSVNVGFNHAFTDVSLSNDGPSPLRQIGYQLTITQRTTKFLNLGFEFSTGSVFGEEQRDSVNLNFRTSLVSPRVTFEYNFYPLLKPDRNGRQLIRPYVGFGLGAVFFRSKGDLRAENGNSYFYWSNGSIYAEPEGSIDISEATELDRDFEYETDLRDANLDGFRKYSQMAFSLPFNAGIRFQITKNIGVNAAFSYVMNFTDLIDNVNSESTGVRQGSAGFDNHLFGSVGLSVFLGTTKPSAKPAPRFEPQLATKEQEKLQQSEKVKTKSESEKRDELAIISAKLSAASLDMQKIAKESESALVSKKSELNSIADQEIYSKKELRSAKQESISILEESISQLTRTNEVLNKTVGEVNSLSSSLSNNQIETQFTNTDKIRSTIDETVPAIQSLKKRIKNAKNTAELKSILNISANNLGHTKDIFNVEAKDINSTIISARKTVIEIRTQKLVSKELIATEDQLEEIEQELSELRTEGVISEEKFEQLQASISKVEPVAQNEFVSSANDDTLTTDDNFLLASELLKNAMISLAETENESAVKLEEHKTALDVLGEKKINGRSELKQAKQKSLKVLDQAIKDLNGTSSLVEASASDLARAKASVSDDLKIVKPIETVQLTESIDDTYDFLQTAKKQVESSKNAAQLKSVVRLASTNLDKLNGTISDKSKNISEQLSASRKEVLEMRLTQAEQSETALSPTESEELKVELDNLSMTEQLNETEYQELSSRIDEASETSSSSVSNASLLNSSSPAEVIASYNLLKKKSLSLLEMGLNLEDKLNTSKAQLESVASSISESETSLREIKSNSNEVLSSISKELNQTERSASRIQRSSNSPKSDTQSPEKTPKLSSKITNSASLLKELNEKIKKTETIPEAEEILRKGVDVLANLQQDVLPASVADSKTLDTERKNLITESLKSGNQAILNPTSSEVETLLASIEDLKSENLIDEATSTELKNRLSKTNESDLANKSEKKNDEPVAKYTLKPESVNEKSASKANADKRGFDTRSIAESEPKTTGDFHWADLDKDDWISPNEVLHFIDLLFEGDAEYDIVDVQSLIDYYFDQD